MTTSPYPRQGGDDGGDRRITVNAGRLWTGGLATAVVAALVAVVGVLFARGLFDVPVLAPPRRAPSATPARPSWPAWPPSPPWPPPG